MSPLARLHTCWFLLRRNRLLCRALGIATVLIASLASWVWWGGWPDPVQGPLFADADALVILGGGDQVRWARGVEMAKRYPGIPVVVTGDENHIVGYLEKHGIPKERVLHEKAATSTVENARFTIPMLDKIGAKRVILVTNWFHVPRSLAIFRKYQPGREFVVSFAPKPETMNP
ncbi:MAG: YdcF family protein [Verrucomicrobiales bacterium]